MSQWDRLYQTGAVMPGSFQFDERVAPVFDNMIRRSVPGYAETLRMTGWLAARYLQHDGLCYDLGCSLGGGLLATAAALGKRHSSATLIGVDSSPAMLAQAREHLASAGLEPAPQLQRADIRSVSLEPCQVVLLNWTLQFLPAGDRETLLARIFAALEPGGALILSEKVVDPDAERQALMEHLHWAFKRSQGYSELEIAGKRTALEAVLVPETQGRHEERLQRLGFRPVLQWYRQLNFVSLLAEKP